MDEVTTDAVRFPEGLGQDPLTSVLRDGAQQLLVQAIEAEVARARLFRGGHKCRPPSEPPKRAGEAPRSMAVDCRNDSLRTTVPYSFCNEKTTRRRMGNMIKRLRDGNVAAGRRGTAGNEHR